jgi:ornithine cyclodeaminase/alanine dehydrogenase
VVTRGQGNWLRALAASPPGLRYMGAKIFGFGRAKSVSYLIALFEQETGALAALVDANLITAYRTAATSAVAVDRLAAAGPAALGVLGSGLERTCMCAPSPTSADRRNAGLPPPANRGPCRQARPRLGIAASVDSAERQSPARASSSPRPPRRTPILRGRWLRRNTVV